MLVSLVDCIQQCASFFQSRLLYTSLQQMVQFNSIDCAIQQALYTVLYITIEQQYIYAVQCEHKSFTYTHTHTCAWPQLQGLSSVMSSVASCPCNASPRSVPLVPELSSCHVAVAYIRYWHCRRLRYESVYEITSTVVYSIFAHSSIDSTLYFVYEYPIRILGVLSGSVQFGSVQIRDVLLEFDTLAYVMASCTSCCRLTRLRLRSTSSASSRAESCFRVIASR